VSVFGLFPWKNWHIFHVGFLEIRAGAGAQFAFFVLGRHLGHRVALRTFFFFFFSAGKCAVGDEKKTGKGKEKEYKIKFCEKPEKKKQKREGRVSEKGPNRLQRLSLGCGPKHD
jgi:hypothetical protein